MSSSSPPPLRLRSKRASGARLNRKAVFVVIAGVAIVIAFSLTYAFQQDTAQKKKNETKELEPVQVKKTPRTAKPEWENVDGYDDLKSLQNIKKDKPQLIEELPPEPIAQPQVIQAIAPAAPVASPAELARLRLEQERLALEKRRLAQMTAENLQSIESPLQFDGAQQAEGGGGFPPEIAAGLGAIKNIQSSLNAKKPAPAPDPEYPDTAVQNMQQQKTMFIEQQAGEKTSDYLNGELTAPASPYEVKAGSILAGALITGVNTDTPGAVTAQVTQNVYDTVSGDHLLIPQGSRLIGNYQSVVSYAQTRVVVVWNRLVMPNGSSIQLEGMIAADKMGQAGLNGDVNNHYGRLLFGAFLSSALAVGQKVVTKNENDDNSTTVAVQGTSDEITRIGQTITDRNLDIQPTITVKPGFPIRIMVHKDMILAPYQETRWGNRSTRNQSTYGW